jgi:Na+/citrate or Na+/malate symporter
MSFNTFAVPCTTTVIQQYCEQINFVPVVSGTVSIFVVVLILAVIVASIVSSLVTYYCCWLKSKRSNKYDLTGPYGIPPGSDGGVGDVSVLSTGNNVELKDNMAYGQVTAGRPPVLPAVYETVNI